MTSASSAFVGLRNTRSTGDHDWRLLRAHAETTDQLLGRGIALQIEPAMRHAIPRAEVPEAARVRRIAGADDAKADPRADQNLAPQEKRAEHDVSERGVLRHEAPQFLRRRDVHLSGLAHDRGEQRRLPRDEAQLAEEAAAAVHGERALVVRAVVGDDLHLAGGDDEERVVPLAFAIEDVARTGRAVLRVRRDQGELLLRQVRERSLEIRCLFERHQTASVYPDSAPARCTTFPVRHRPRKGETANARSR